MLRKQKIHPVDCSCFAQHWTDKNTELRRQTGDTVNFSAGTYDLPLRTAEKNTNRMFRHNRAFVPPALHLPRGFRACSSWWGTTCGCCREKVKGKAKDVSVRATVHWPRKVIPGRCPLDQWTCASDCQGSHWKQKQVSSSLKWSVL